MRWWLVVAVLGVVACADGGEEDSGPHGCAVATARVGCQVEVLWCCDAEDTGDPAAAGCRYEVDGGQSFACHEGESSEDFCPLAIDEAHRECWRLANQPG